MIFKYGFIDWFMDKIVCPILVVFAFATFFALLSLIGTFFK